MEASKSGQMGQPAAWMMANTQDSSLFRRGPQTTPARILRFESTAHFIWAIMFRQGKLRAACRREATVWPRLSCATPEKRAAGGRLENFDFFIHKSCG
jgi:hypothetical protein